MKIKMNIIKTIWGNVKVISSNLEELRVNGFYVSLEKKSEYIENINTLSEDFIKRTIEKRLEKEIVLSGEEEKISIRCTEESYGEEIAASWKICFKMIKDNERKRKRTKLVNLRFADTKEDIPFEIKDTEVWIKIGNKKVRVPIFFHPSMGELSRKFSFFCRRLEAIYR